MRRFKLSAVCILYFLSCGYIFLENQPDSYYLEQLGNAKNASEAVLEGSYAEAFAAALNVLRDFNVNIVKKDCENRLILGDYYLGDCQAVYGIFFSEGSGDKVKTTVKSTGKCFSAGFILKKIAEEITISRRLR